MTETQRTLISGSGKFPGSGSSTSMSLLVDILNQQNLQEAPIQLHQSGLIRRKFAIMWNSFLQENHITDPNQQHWSNFEDHLESEYLKDKPGFFDVANKSVEHDESILAQFNQAQDRLCSECSKLDLYPELALGYRVSQNEGITVAEGKLAILSEQIKEVVQEFPELANPLLNHIKFLFISSLEESVRKIETREISNNNADPLPSDPNLRQQRFNDRKLQTEDRVDDDWSRWSIIFHKINSGEGITIDDLEQTEDVNKIKVDGKLPWQIVQEMLGVVSQKIPGVIVPFLSDIEDFFKKKNPDKYNQIIQLAA